MADYNDIKQSIATNLPDNNKREITAAKLRSTLNEFVDKVEATENGMETEINAKIARLENAGYQFAGVATKDTNPNTPEAKVFYIADGKGVYTNFGGISVTEDEVVVLYYDTAWHKEVTGIASHKTLTSFKEDLEEKIIDVGERIVPFYLEQEITFTDSSQKICFDNLNLKGGEYFLKFRIESNNAVWSKLALYSNNNWGSNVDKWYYLSNNTEYIKENVNDIHSLWLYLIEAQQFGTIKVTLKIYNKLIDEAVTTPKVANKAITSEKIANNAVTIKQISFKDEIRSANRCDTSACVHGYIDKHTGVLDTSISTRYASDFIPVSEKGLYCSSPSGYGKMGGNAVYDANENFLRGFTDNVYNYQDGDAYVRWTLSTNSVENSSVYIIEGTSAGSYTPFVPTKFIIKSEYLPVLGKEYLPALSLCGKDSIVSSSNTIAAGISLQIDNFPQYLKGNGIVSFSGNLTSFDDISVGFGTSTNSIAVKVDATNVYIIKSGSKLVSTIAHGLNISDFINITFERDLVTPKIVVSSISGLFVHTMSPFENIEFYGLPIATMGAGTVVTNAILRATSNRFNKPIWVCGDSYTSLYDERWTKQMINTIEEDNFLLIGLAGGESSQIYSDLIKALAFGTPKFLVWCLGMNDTYANWSTTFESLKTLCSQNGIELILQTIPIPNLSTSNNQVQINGAIKASGYRYVDAALAMSPNSSYPWYDGYNADGIHPTILGAKVLASRFLSDFPEFMQ